MPMPSTIERAAPLDPSMFQLAPSFLEPLAKFAQAQDLKATVRGLLDRFEAAPPPSPHDVMVPGPANGTLYVRGQGDTNTVDFDDVKQGQMGNCGFCAALAAVARQNPDVIKNAITENRNASGEVESYTVRLYLRDDSGRLRPRDIQVDAKQFGQNAIQNGDASWVKTEIWTKVVEKAFAQAMGGYAKSLRESWPETVTEALTGVDAKSVAPKDTSFAQLQSDVAAGKPVSVWTPKGDGKNLREANMIADHAYAVVDSKVENGVQMVKLYNPWGPNQTQPGTAEADGGWITFEQYQTLLSGQTTGTSLTDGTLELLRRVEQGRLLPLLRG